jgi:hypothetical protein
MQCGAEGNLLLKVPKKVKKSTVFSLKQSGGLFSTTFVGFVACDGQFLYWNFFLPFKVV